MNLDEIAARTEVRHEEYLRRFTTLDDGQLLIDTKLDSLLASRAFYRGALRMACYLSAGISTLIGLFFAWHQHP
jgi:hypothetical protein